MYETIHFEKESGVATIAMNRPDKLNAFDDTLHEEIRDALDAAANDREVRCVVLRGEGRGVSVGADLSEILKGGGDIDLGEHLRESYGRLLPRIAGLEKPVVAALHGPIYGAGLGLALACDLRIAAESASFSAAFVKIGLVPDAGVTARRGRGRRRGANDGAGEQGHPRRGVGRRGIGAGAPARGDADGGFSGDEARPLRELRDSPSHPGLPGPENLKRAVGERRVALPDTRNVIVDVAEGDKVAVRWSTHATHRGEFVGIAATGNRIAATSFGIFRSSGGRIVESWDTCDADEMMQQPDVDPLPSL